MKKVIEKTFIYVINHHHLDRKLIYRYLEDKRLTQNEKKILKCLLLLRESKFNEILSILTSLKIDQEQIIESQRSLILGIVYLNIGHLSKSESELLKSVKHLEGFDVRRQYFLAYYNLSILYKNQKNAKLLAQAIDSIEKYLSHDDITEKIVFLRLKFLQQMELKFFDQCQETLQQLKKLNKETPAGVKLALTVDEFSFHLMLGNFKDAYKCLAKLKTMRSFNFSALYQYSFSLLETILHQKPFYLYERDFINFPQIYHQIRFIKSLEKNDPVLKKEAWLELQKISPDLYQENFQYLGDNILFKTISQTLQSSSQIDTTKLPENKEEALLAILQHSQGAVSQEVIYQALWKEKPIDKNSYNKLSKLVSRTNKKFNFNIKFQNNCYQFFKEKKKAS
jgi:DNA-binding winged helix-turn-helix (wHTH) protein